MFRDAESVMQDALQLPPEDRLRLADRIYESVPEDDVARAWLDEVERRDAEWDAGTAEGVELDEVLREARAKLRK
jgi:putative addiction module component (TIGR02574 family)